MTERFLHIAVIANDGDNETAEGYILDVVDGAVQDRYVQIVLLMRLAMIGSFATSPRKERERTVWSSAFSLSAWISMWESCSGTSEDMTEPTNFSESESADW